jgi:hypothetical protein
MTIFINAGGYKYHIEGGYIPTTDSYHIAFKTQYDHSRDPEHKINRLSFNVDNDEFDLLIAELIKMRQSAK